MTTRRTEWAIVELRGQRRTAGNVSEILSYGVPMLRVDVPRPDGTFFTQIYGGWTIYCLTMTTEDLARAYAAKNIAEPPALLQLTPLPVAQPAARDCDCDDCRREHALAQDLDLDDCVTTTLWGDMNFSQKNGATV